MESNRAVLGIQGDARSGMSICIAVHVMKAACKHVEVLLAFGRLLAVLSRDLNVVYIGKNVSRQM